MGDESPREILDKVFARRNPKRKLVSTWLAANPDKRLLFFEYVEAYEDMRTSSSHKLGVSTLLEALQADDNVDLGEQITVTALRNWLRDEYPGD